MKNSKKDSLQNLIDTLLIINDRDTLERFLKDLCTPQELNALQERWRVCQLLNEGTLTYREIHDQTRASLATIVRVARFLKK